MIYPKLLLVLAIYPILLATSAVYVYANDAWDYSEKYEDVPGAPECYHDGYLDGQNDDFDHGRNKECKDKGNEYYSGFINGCQAEGNDKDVCENFTDG